MFRFLVYCATVLIANCRTIENESYSHVLRDRRNGTLIVKRFDQIEQLLSEALEWRSTEDSVDNLLDNVTIEENRLSPREYQHYRRVYGLRYNPAAKLTHRNVILPPSTESNDILTIHRDNSLASNETTSLNEQDLLSNEVFVHPDVGESSESIHVMNVSRVQKAFALITQRLKQLFGIAYTEPNTVATTATDHKFPVVSSGTGNRFLNLFSIINFENSPCVSTQKPLRQLNGTCYHRVECDQMGGAAVDTCANGFGVCCIFQIGCGGVTKQNISYFENPGFPAPAATRLTCTLTISLLPGVRQVMLEFIHFELRPPTFGNCTEDQFVVSGNSINNPVPIICGINSGQHMYIDVTDSPNRQLYLTVLAAMDDKRLFNIRVSQLTNNLAPEGCLQFYRTLTGFVQTFNYDTQGLAIPLRTPGYFNNLNYAICIGRVAGFCRVTYSSLENGSEEYQFQMTNVDEDGVSITPLNQAGVEIFSCADDYIAVNGIRLCGEKLNDGSLNEDFTRTALVTDTSNGPIILPVRTNGAVVGRGFKLRYTQQPCQFI